MFNVSYNEAVQLGIGAAVGLGLSITMEKNGLSISDPETRWTTLAYLTIFSCMWVTAMSALEIAHFAES